MTKEKPHLFQKATDTLSAEEERSVLDIYKMLVDMADKVSQRRQNANNFYLSVNTAIIGASSYIALSGHEIANILFIAITGIGVCLIWLRNIESYKTLNEAKFKVINELERALPVSPYTVEWSHLDPEGTGNRHKPFHLVEIYVPRIFVALHLAQGLRAIPWAGLFEFAERFSRCISTSAQ
jgi:hypothetical protein